MKFKKIAASLLLSAALLGSSLSVMAAEGGCPPHRFIDRVYSQTSISPQKHHLYVYATDKDGNPTEYKTCYYNAYLIHFRIRCADCHLENGEIKIEEMGELNHDCGK